MKKMLAVWVSALILGFGAAAAEDSEYNIPEKVEIAFNVGDDVLVINGEEVTTETAPYVVETAAGGVTLVPVRVITEAFGAVVGWEEATQTVTLDYPDVKIILQIGNPVAEVNDEAVTLLTSPELPDGRTMVPLRFISETFGAEVGYDDETQAVTVVKSAAQEGDTIAGAIETKYIGDSKMSWMMLNPGDLTLSSRYDDGTYTRFTDGSNSIAISINQREDDFDFEAEFKALKKSEASNRTLSKADKNSDNAELMTMHFQSRTSSSFYDRKVFVTSERIYYVYVTVSNDAVEAKSELLALSESFKVLFEADDVHDFYKPATVEDRTFISEEMGIKLLLPENFSAKSSGSKVNEFVFYAKDNSCSLLYLNIVSSSETTSPKETSEMFKEDLIVGLDTEAVKVGDVQEMKLGNIDAFVVDQVVEGSKYGYLDAISKMISFKLGDYTYLFQISIDLDTENYDAVMSEILENAEFTPIDSEKVGIILDGDEYELQDDYEITVSGVSFKVPGFLEKSGSGSSFQLSSQSFSKMDLTIEAEVLAIGYTAKDMLGQLKMIAEQYATSGEEVKFSEITEKKLGDTTYYIMDVETNNAKSCYYDKLTVYACDYNGKMYMLSATGIEFYEEYRIQTVEEILSTMKKVEEN